MFGEFCIDSGVGFVVLLRAVRGNPERGQLLFADGGGLDESDDEQDLWRGVVELWRRVVEARTIQGLCALVRRERRDVFWNGDRRRLGN